VLLPQNFTKNAARSTLFVIKKLVQKGGKCTQITASSYYSLKSTLIDLTNPAETTPGN
jgi:hypothetical protein